MNQRVSGKFDKHGNNEQPYVAVSNGAVPEPASKQHLSDRSFTELRLRLATLLHSDLDIKRIIESFFSNIQQLISIDGFRYRLPKLALDFDFGYPATHSCQYRVIEERKDLGEITFSSRCRFSQRDLEVLETLIATLQAPLRNGILYQEALRAAMTDPLTSVGSRAALDSNLDHVLGISHRHQQPCSLLLIDIDHFKQVNDRFGHSTGDEVLRAVAEQMSQTVRKTDQCFRYGGEEFVVVLERTGAAGSHIIAERIRRQVEQLRLKFNDQFIPITVSIGIATVPPHRSAQTLFEEADQALYFAKNNGRNRIVHHAAMESLASESAQDTQRQDGVI